MILLELKMNIIEYEKLFIYYRFGIDGMSIEPYEKECVQGGEKYSHGVGV